MVRRCSNFRAIRSSVNAYGFDRGRCGCAEDHPEMLDERGRWRVTKPPKCHGIRGICFVSKDSTYSFLKNNYI